MREFHPLPLLICFFYLSFYSFFSANTRDSRVTPEAKAGSPPPVLTKTEWEGGGEDSLIYRRLIAGKRSQASQRSMQTWKAGGRQAREQTSEAGNRPVGGLPVSFFD